MTAMLVVLAARDAQADWMSRAAARLQGGAYLHHELTALTVIDDEVDRPVAAVARDQLMWSARLHGFVGMNASVAYHVGVSVGLGGTTRRGGFAYDVALYPLGVLVRTGATGIVGISTGVGVTGATGALDDAVTIPVELVVELGRAHRLLARARIAYVAGAASRQSAAPSVPFADELDALLAVRLGRAHDRFQLRSGNGYFLGASYRELGGIRFAGLTLGYSIDLAQPRRPR